ncbi:MAG: endonuclease/exonuclease/phosphatase family protein [Allosphingosinicella sp.]
MPFYYSIKDEPPEVRRRTAKGLLALRNQLADENVPSRTISDKLLLATWNLREFDSSKYGKRTNEALHYIAEIISHFDIVAIQEVREDLSALDQVQKMLGGWWKYIVTDVTQGTSGNGERMAFIFDGRKVTFGGLAGEVVIPPLHDEPQLQFARTPFICGFRAGWVKFNLCTVHIYYGKAVANDQRRVEEISDIAEFLAKRGKPGQDQPASPDGKITPAPARTPENIVLLGDFNIFKREDRTFEGLTDAGFVIPDEMRRLQGSNLGQSKFFDQIAILKRDDRFETTGRAGVFNYSKSVFRDDEEAAYVEAMGEDYAKKAEGPERGQYYRDWRTYQISDHLLLWCELKIDFGPEYLTRLMEAAAEAASGDDRNGDDGNEDPVAD